MNELDAKDSRESQNQTDFFLFLFQFLGLGNQNIRFQS